MMEALEMHWRNTCQRKELTKAPASSAPTAVTKEELKREFGISSSGSDDGDQLEEKTPIEAAGCSSSAADAPRIRLNPKTRWVGAHGRRRSHRQPEKCPTGNGSSRQRVGGRKLFGATENKNLKFKQMKNSVTTNGPFYILPPTLLAACQKYIPLSNTAVSAIEVKASQDTSAGRATGNNSTMKEVVLIKVVGNYTREQIELSTSVQNLREVVQLGLDMHE
ncbi:hypothetical protein PHMEG_0007177 [Phytophthora megakarya]|uniref:Uncharacterized protein n=1 Tax=Phytophthora megakarya TaxID=4795 RepID=A0A225WN58_9STRA|nr:hypothetical protein PHMEG_0007177 [Phytophthora megakarya]